MSVSADVWVSKPEAERRTGFSRNALDRAITEGKIRQRRLPGAHPRVRLDDVERLAEAAEEPATASASERPPGSDFGECSPRTAAGPPDPSR